MSGLGAMCGHTAIQLLCWATPLPVLYLVISEGAAHLLAAHVLIQCDLPKGLIALDNLRSTLCNLL